jgi:L-lactate dehydrogenase (cytochrome)
MSTTMLGTKCDIPFYVTATALGKLGNPEGEVILTRGAHKHNVIQMIPTLASCSFDEILDEAKDGQVQWLQLYVNKDREVTKRIVEHAEKRGCKGLFITVDAPQLGRREKDMRSKFDDVGSNVQSTGGDNVDRSQGAARAISSFIDPSLSWKDIPWFKSITKMPIILKGVQCVEDVIRAVEVGVDGVVLSNHGGRQLDFARSGVEVLAEVMPILRARGWQDRIEVYIPLCHVCIWSTRCRPRYATAEGRDGDEHALDWRFGRCGPQPFDAGHKRVEHAHGNCTA